MLKVGILGYGGIARTHKIAYELLASQKAPVELVALCDVNPEQFAKDIVINTGKADDGFISKYHTYTNLEEMLANEKLDLIDICLPTYLHCKYAVSLLKRGYHVLCEKPMARTSAECDAMLAAAEESGKKLMIGMVLRFTPAYLKLKELIENETYGKVTSAHFGRHSTLPYWGFEEWFQNYDCSGGVGLDMHIHDVDMIRFLFGEPKAVSALTDDSKMKCTTIHSSFLYDDKPVTATGDWGASTTWKFECNYRVNFERATLVMINKEIMVYPDSGEPYKAELSSLNGFAEEILYFARTILGEFENTKNDPADAAGSVHLVEKLMQSAENNSALTCLK